MTDYADLEKRLRDTERVNGKTPIGVYAHLIREGIEAADAIASLRELIAWIAELPADTEEDYIESFAAVKLRLNERQQPVSEQSMAQAADGVAKAHAND